MTESLVSVIIPTYNSSKSIVETLDSVLNQTHEKIEVIVVDDCSTDDTVSKIQEIERDNKNISLYQLSENSGVSQARNLGLDKANGEYIAFLDSDDVWLKDKLEYQIEYMKKSGYDATYTSYSRMDFSGVIFGAHRVKDGEIQTYDKLLIKNAMGCSTVIVKASAIAGFKFPLIKKRNDLAFWLLLCKHGVEFHGLPQSTVNYRVYRDSLSGNKVNAAKYQWILYREYEKLSFIKSLKVFFMYFARNIFERLVEKAKNRKSVSKMMMPH